MQTENEIRKKLSQILKRKLSRRFKAQLKRKPCNCHFNREHKFLKDGKEESIRLCMLGLEKPEWKVDICETTEQAVSCPAFLLKTTKEDVEKKFEEDLHNEEWLKENHLDIYTLFWVLGEVKMRLSIWQRILIFLECLKLYTYITFKK